MKIRDLKAGKIVTIEMVRADDTVEFTTKVIGSNDSGLLLSPYVSEGRVLELNSKKSKNNIFNLYCVDEYTGERRSWKGITIATISHRNAYFYAVVVNSFGRYGVPSERRMNRRMIIDRDGVLANISKKERHYVTIHDISDSGISFYGTDLFEGFEGYVKIVMDDQIRGHYFRLEIPCEYVRQQDVDGKILYGCRITNADKNLLNYVSLKRMEMRRG